MQIEITVADDRMSAQVGDVKLVVGGPITFKQAAGKKLYPGIIMGFAVIDKKDMKSPWCYAKDNKGEITEWFSLRNWAAEQNTEAPVQPKKEEPVVIAPVVDIAPPPQMDDNDYL